MRTHILYGSDGQFWAYNGRIWVATDETLVRKAVLESARKSPTKMAQGLDGMVKQVVSLMRAQLATANDKLRLNGEPPQIINCQNGELWINPDGSVELRRHDHQSYLRHCINADFDRNAVCPRYDQALSAVFQKTDAPEDVIRHWHELTGYMLQPRRPTPLILVLQGGGSNGKTALMSIFERLLGNDLISHQAIGSLESNRFAFASLLGKFVLIDDDVKAGSKMPDGELKKISENKSVTAERKFGQPFNFRCMTLPVFLTNNVMSLADVSPGIQRRLMVVPFQHTFTDKDRDHELVAQVAASELSGVLNRCLTGLEGLIHRRYRFKTPKSVTLATDEWMRQANPLPAFLKEKTTKDQSGSVLVRDLYQAYNQWASESGITFRQQQTAFTRNMEHLGLRKRKRNQGATFIGLRLKSG